MYSFIVDFLRYDFVRDAQTIAVAIQRQLFEISKTAGGFQAYPDFDTFLTSNDYSSTALLDDEAVCNIGAIQLTAEQFQFLENTLGASGEEELTELWKYVVCDKTPADCSQTINHKARNWAKSAIVSRDSKNICRIVCFYAKQSLMNKAEYVAEAILSQASDKFDLKDDLLTVGVNPESLAVQSGQTLEKAARSLLRNLAKKAYVFVTCDNADRAIWSSVELEIFRSCWNFLPQITTAPPVRLIFAMRLDTFYRHHKELKTLHFNYDIRGIANVDEGTVLKPPSFLDIARVRIDTLKKRLKEQGGGSRALEVMENYIERVLESEHVSDIFDKLFCGDQRRNLQSFELAVASPHITYSDAYYFTEYGIDKAEDDTGGHEYIRRHILLKSLMLGPWNVFRQDRSQVFMNVYNCPIPAALGQEWRRTLIMPRILKLLELAGHYGEKMRDLVEFFANHLGYDAATIHVALDTLTKFRLVEYVLAGRYLPFVDQSEDSARVILTTSGMYYSCIFMFRLEYLQTVYWDMSIPSDLYFHGFHKGLQVRDLAPFLERLCQFIEYEEHQEERAISPDVRETLLGLDSGKTLALRIREVAGGQIANIHWARRH